MTGLLSPGIETLLSLLGVWIAGSVFAILSNNSIDRIPRHQSLVSPKPYCRSCATALSWQDLIPVWSYLRHHGKCPYCGAQWPKRQIITEILEIAWVAVFILRYGWSYPAFITMLFGVGLIVIIIIELESRVLPDNLLLGMGALGMIYVLAYSQPEFPYALASLVVGALVLIVYNLLRSLLPGEQRADFSEIKFAAVLGLFLGLPKLLLAILLAWFIGSILGIFGVYKLQKSSQQFLPRFPALLSTAGLVVILFGNDILNLYYRFIH
ncbi:MAG: prepilin peptidase [Lentisphaeria bacterium]|nr:prepilin peptidase [Candidatus Neomarinimicrobiota bacterium]MCF7842930.1 prepilin peptidase [Lentisphaeria bacterium]